MHSHTTLLRFRQDLRIQDNTALLYAIDHSTQIIPVFIFDTDVLEHFPEQDARLGFVIQSVQDLEKQLQAVWSWLIVRHGSAREIIPQLIKEYWCTMLCHNKSYGEWSLIRDIDIQRKCLDIWCLYISCHDFLLVEPDAIPQRKVFTPYFNLWKKIDKKPPSSTIITSIPSPSIPLTDRSSIQSELSFSHTIYWPIDWWKQRLSRDYSTYNESRNTLSSDGTTMMAPYMRFGLVSIRELYHTRSHNDGAWYDIIISELARREFWHHIMHYFPTTRTQSFQEKRRAIKWENNIVWYEKWKNGQTWYPIIDAAMIQLRTENRMHNRARMIFASFLTKDLLIDWTWWEKHFAQYLLDYDSCVNIGNRQRAASVGADPKPLRIFSPILQAQRFDPDAVYIKKYLPELAHIEPYRLHDPLTYHLPYIAPIVDHSIMQRVAKERYAQSSKDFI